jgi:integrase
VVAEVYMGRKPAKGRPKPFGIGDVRCRATRGPKDGRWYWRAEIHGEKRTVWTGWASRKEAQQVVAQLVAEGIQPPAPPTTDEVHMDDVRTVGDLLDVWVGMQQDRQDIAERSVRVYAQAADRITPIVGHVLMDRMTVRQMELIRDTMLRAGRAPRTVLLDLQRLQAAWTWGQEMTIAPLHPLPLPTVRLPKEVKRTPTPAEVAAVLEQVTIPWRHLAIRLMYQTGARIGEVASLTWDQVDLVRGVIVVTGKTGPRPIPLQREMHAELQRLHAVSQRPEVLSVTYNTARVGIQRELARACEAAGVQPWSSHGFRRATVDQLLRAGIDIGTAAALMGHSPQVMLQHYRQATADDLVDAVQRARLGVLPAGDVVEFKKKNGE